MISLRAALKYGRFIWLVKEKVFDSLSSFEPNSSKEKPHKCLFLTLCIIVVVHGRKAFQTAGDSFLHVFKQESR